MSFSSVKAVLIDIDNTLLDFGKCSYLAMQKAFSTHGLSFSDSVFTTFTKTNDELWKRIERGEYTRELLHKERWNIILQKLGMSYDGVKIEKSFLDNLYDCIAYVDGALEIVKYLSGKYYLCTASNAPNDQQYNRLKISGILPYVKKVFTSEAIGVDKPQKEFFDRCFAQMDGFTKEETVMIGDSLTADIHGAKVYGLKTLWFNYNHIQEPSEKFYDAKVENLLEIKNIL